MALEAQVWPLSKISWHRSFAPQFAWVGETQATALFLDNIMMLWVNLLLNGNTTCS
jgi:hypothetical protein